MHADQRRFFFFESAQIGVSQRPKLSSSQITDTVYYFHGAVMSTLLASAA
jgi:hypothetical protein